MAVSPRLHDVQTMQDLMLPTVSRRGIQLASLFMAGVETAVFANDVCGSPIPWNFCAPWHFFDGKLFHYKLLKANENLPLIDLCDGQINQVRQVERLRQAIMENLNVEFPRPHINPAAMYCQYPQGPFPPQFAFQTPGTGILPHPSYARGMRPPGMAAGGIPAGMGHQQEMSKQTGRGRGILGRSPVDTRGGQLEIAGVVVGSWGPNLSHNREDSFDMDAPEEREGYRGMPRGGMGMRPPMGMRGMGMRGGMIPRQAGPGMYNQGMAMRGYMGGMRSRGGMMYGRSMPRGIRRGVRGYSVGRGLRMPQERSYGRFIARPRSKVRVPKIAMKTGKGRGMTIETVKEGVEEESPYNGDEEIEEEEEEEDDEETGAEFADAEDDVISPTRKGSNPLDAAQSPDSGIHGDKSSSDINIPA